MVENNTIFSEKVIKALEAVDLTQYEISLYLTLIQEGPLNARDLSTKSNVPYSRIYNILSILLEKGFITRDDSQRPSTFVANSPDEALMLARKKVMDDFNESSQVIVDELKDIYLKNMDAPIQLPLLVYRGKEAVFKKASTILGNASHSILIAVNDLEELEANKIIIQLEELRKSGIEDIKLLIQENQKDLKLVDKLQKIADIRARDQIFGTGIVVDSTAAIIILKAKIFMIESYFGLRSDHMAFGPIALQYFNYLFETAEPVVEG